MTSKHFYDNELTREEDRKALVHTERREAVRAVEINTYESIDNPLYLLSGKSLLNEAINLVTDNPSMSAGELTHRMRNHLELVRKVYLKIG